MTQRGRERWTAMSLPDRGEGIYTFAFVDLAGFTALTDAHGDRHAFDQVERFLALAAESVIGSTAVVKAVGDAVMLVAEAPAHAVESCLALLEAVAAQPMFPLARAGVHTGSAVCSDGDFLGTGVNVASRITGHAAGGQLVLTAEPAAAARVLGLTVHELGAVTLRNIIDPVELFRIDADAQANVIDPVCRMGLASSDAAGRLTYQGHDYWFCSLDCVAAFAARPDGYVSQNARA